MRTALAMVVVMSSCGESGQERVVGLCELAHREWIAHATLNSKSTFAHPVSGKDISGHQNTFNVFDGDLTVTTNLVGEAPSSVYADDEVLADGRSALRFMSRLNDRPYLSQSGSVRPENGVYTFPHPLRDEPEVVAENDIAARINAYRSSESIDGGSCATDALH